MISQQFVRFMIVGGVAACVNIGSRYLLSFYMDYSLAIILAFILGLSTGFILSSNWVFSETTRPPGQQAAWFVLINLLALGQVWVVSFGLAEWLFPKIGNIPYRYDLAHVIGVLSPVFTSYLGHKHFSFRGS